MLRMESIAIDIVSDLVCPWCYIGKRHLETALAAMGKDAPPVAIRWHPFQLNPDLPRAGMARKTYVETKFGGPERAAQVYDRVKDAGDAAGLALRFDKIEHQPNTLAGHALVALAQDSGLGDAVVEALFKAFFIDGRNIGEREVLLDVGQRCGLAAGTLNALLDDESTLANIAAQDQAVRAQGISGVPFFVLGKKFSLSGAQPPATIQQAISHLIAEQS
jgi:predicted DsbA family dithiol-disulfide isomerase